MPNEPFEEVAQSGSWRWPVFPLLLAVYISGRGVVLWKAA